MLLSSIDILFPVLFIDLIFIALGQYKKAILLPHKIGMSLTLRNCKISDVILPLYTPRSICRLFCVCQYLILSVFFYFTSILDIVVSHSNFSFNFLRVIIHNHKIISMCVFSCGNSYSFILPILLCNLSP